MSDPKGFLKHPRKAPERKPVAERLGDWKEFYLPQSEQVLKDQASRCMDCGVPFCQSGNGCPVENLIPEWNDLVQRGLWRDALKSLHATNNFPEFTGKLCPAPCESACVLGIPSEPVTIRNIESAIIDRGFAEGWVRPMPASQMNGRRVAIIGSGPAGLAAAQQLARAGYSVTVFEKADRPGGLLLYGIPEFKMEKKVLDRRLDQLRAEGVEFKTGVNVGVSFPTEALFEDFEAICLTIGAEEHRELPVPGRELLGIYPAMQYLTKNAESAQGKHVVIIGGGDTGSDCLGTIHREGCATATQFEILPQPPRDRASTTPWPLWPMQFRTSHAHEEGGVREWSICTTGFVGDSGRVCGVQTQRSHFNEGKIELLPGTEKEIPADIVLLALGFTGPVRSGLIDQLKLELDPRGAIRTDGGYMTSRTGVFAAGDARRGASLIVWAIAEGRKMAAAVENFLR